MLDKVYRSNKRFHIKGLLITAFIGLCLLTAPFIKTNQDFARIYLTKDREVSGAYLAEGEKPPKRKWGIKLNIKKGDPVYLKLQSQDKQGVKIGRFYIKNIINNKYPAAKGKPWGEKIFEPGKEGYDTFLSVERCLEGGKLEPGHYELRLETEDPNGGVNTGLARLVVE